MLYEADYGLLTPIFTGHKDLNAESFSKEEEIYAGELKKLLTDEVLFLHYKEKALERAADFSMESYITNIERLIK